MKLRNKTTGEIGNLISTNWNEMALTIMDKDGVQLAKYTSLAELNTEWEDYEEPKEYWCITGRGNLHHLQDMTDENDKDHREIGNYFETEEEAELAVEKLKAWKRLKDHNLETEKATPIADGRKGKRMKAIIFYANDYDNFLDDLDTCFGGEE